MLRLLSPARAGPSRSAAAATPTLHINVPNYGAIIMAPPPDPRARTSEPQNDYILTGEVEVVVPASLGRIRCRAIRVAMKSTISLDMGPGRGWEEDELFQRKVEIIGCNADGIWLEEGTQRFEFTIVVPATIAPHDWHPNGRIYHGIFAEIEGLPAPTPQASASSSSLLNLRSRSRSRQGVKRDVASPSARSPAGSPGASRAASPTPLPGAHVFNPALITAAQSLSITRQESCFVIPAPTYEEAQASAAAPPAGDLPGHWLRGTVEQKRTIMFVFNPNPNGGTTELSQRYNGVAAGLGAWDISLVSDVWTICALLQARLTIPAPSPAVTLFSFRVQLAQTHAIISPRDDPATTKPISATRHFVVVEAGKRPPKAHLHPDRHIPALWRGEEAGGRDTGELRMDSKGRLPNDDVARPSTLPGFMIEAFFSVYGEDEQGKPMKVPGPGGLRMLRVTQPVILPSCAFVPENVALPNYDEHTADTSLSRPGAPCVQCGAPPDKRLCTACDASVPPHPRHDHPAKLVGNIMGVCLVCSKTLFPVGGPGWRSCACGVELALMEERMRQFTLDERAEAEEASGNAGVDNKIEAERGRGRRGREL